ALPLRPQLRPPNRVRQTARRLDLHARAGDGPERNERLPERLRQPGL
ncbi:MAG: hypothetical protein AVDCRST_MAG55-2016, partial [uncultured Rubrobacteraceae bacterium]